MSNAAEKTMVVLLHLLFANWCGILAFALSIFIFDGGAIGHPLLCQRRAVLKRRIAELEQRAGAVRRIAGLKRLLDQRTGDGKRQAASFAQELSKSELDKVGRKPVATTAPRPLVDFLTAIPIGGSTYGCSVVVRAGWGSLRRRNACGVYVS